MTIQEQYENLEKTVRGYNPAADFQHIRAAFEFAAEAHKDQKRKSGEPYIIHPLAVAQIVAEELRLDSESIEAALLHDVIEDTAATHEQVSKLFSPTIADLVEGVSKLTRIQYATKEDEQMENLRKMLIATTCGPWSTSLPPSRSRSLWRLWRSTPPSPTGWVCSASSGSWRTCP